MVQFRDNRLMRLTRHAVTMQSLRFHVAAAAAVAVMCASIIKVASKKEAAP